jgi:hypothetical protein
LRIVDFTIVPIHNPAINNPPIDNPPIDNPTINNPTIHNPTIHNLTIDTLAIHNRQSSIRNACPAINTVDYYWLSGEVV